MKSVILAGLAFGALAAPAAASPSPALALPLSPAAAVTAALGDAVSNTGVHVWVDGYRDVYRPGERMRVRLRTEDDAYVAVFHIDTNGDVDVLYPRSSLDDGWVPARRTVTLGSRGGWDYLRVRGGYGMGYVFAVALDEPLEMWRVEELYAPRSGWSEYHTVYGDPFYAMDEIVRAVVPESAYGYESVDYYTYHIGRRYTHPRYACYDGWGDWYASRSYSYGSCDRVRVVLVNYPWYYDTRRWYGSRRVYYERYYASYPRASRPLHGYKERTAGAAPPPARAVARRPEPRSAAPDRVRDAGRADRPAAGRDGTPASAPRTRDARPEPRPRDEAAPRTRSTERSTRPETRRPSRGDGAAPSTRREPRVSRPAVRDRAPSDAAPRQEGRPVAPQRDRPTFQRRPTERSAQPRQEPRRQSEPRRQAEPRREPARQSQPRQAEPRQRDSGSDQSSRPSAPPPRSRSPER